MTTVLYNSAVSGNCYKVRLLAAQLGLELELRELDVIDRSNRQEVLGDLNPALRVPTLVLDDGRPLGESNAILWYLADGTEYVPTDRYERAQVLQWQMFEQYSHEPYIAVARFWRIAGIEPSEEQRAEKMNWGNRALAAMDGHLRKHPYLAGDRYTIADISLYAYTHVASEGGFEIERYPAILPWLERVAAQPGHIGLSD
ncbi:MAG: glutathione S-transferase family protein [Solirubrobacteraceae bacterium]